VTEFAATRADHTDGEYNLLQNETGSAHLHVIGTGQMCPLHIHRRTHEATVIVAGQPTIRTFHGESGALVGRGLLARPGTLVASPPFCGHEWNNLTGAPQGNLVFASPPFDGNLYLRDDDPRMLPGSAPFVDVPDPAAPAGREPLPVADGHLERLVVTGNSTVEADPRVQSVAYVALGSGNATTAATTLPVRPGSALLLTRDVPTTLSATPGDPLTVYLFSPPRSRGDAPPAP
jgi:hypothetical protein